MRIRLLMLAVAAGALAGCASNPPVEGVEPAGPPPMRVWMGYPVGSSSRVPIVVNREAYVAMFEIIPGRGATMLYPRAGPMPFASEAHYADLRMQPGRMFYHSDPFGYAGFQPRYYYAVASAAPLNLARLRSSLGATHRVLGRMYASYRPYDVIDRLTELVVPMQADEDWATDLFVDWPMPLPPRSFLAHRFVRCANGKLIVVAGDYPYFGCPGDARPVVVASSATPPTNLPPPPEVPPPPRGPGRRPIELSAPDVGTGRRAEAGAPPPRAGGRTRSPSTEGIRYSDDRRSTRSAGEPSRSSDSRGASSEASSTGRQTAERNEPRARPAPERSTPSEGSNKGRKPQ